MGKINASDQFIRLVDQYKNLVFSICLKLTGDYFAAEDLTQDTFVAAYLHWQDFDGIAEKAWLCRIAHNKCIDYSRAAARRMVVVGDTEELPEFGQSTDMDPLTQYLNRETMEAFRRSCEALPEPYRSTAILHYIKGHTAAEIAEYRKIPKKTVQTHIYRARNLLRDSIRKEELR